MDHGKILVAALTWLGDHVMDRQIGVYREETETFVNRMSAT